jgi:GrpB-like predicted nucleotidyltransferase (UPF0157 family)
VSTVEVVAHDARWAGMFHQERALLERAVPQARAIEHIGSTSVPGLAAKPTIDILLVVHDIADALNRRDALAAIGYAYRPDSFVAADDHLFFRKIHGGHRTHHLHVFAASSAKLDEHRLFRDYLIANSAAARRYEQVKLALAARYANERSRYVAEKATTVVELLAEARTWRSTRTA